MTDWFQDWFGQDYLDLYPHRNAADAARLTSLITRTVGVDGRDVLDLACGPGRHAVSLQERGARVTGIDLSETLIRMASATGCLRPVRGDMRWLPFAPNSFDVVVNLFTSFGYFEDDAEHLRVLKEVARTLRPGGHFVLDFLNSTSAVANLIPAEEVSMGAEQVAVTREITGGGRFVVKAIKRLRDEAVFQERVRLFTGDELTELIGEAGLRVEDSYGDYDGNEASPTSPRLILRAVKQ